MDDETHPIRLAEKGKDRYAIIWHHTPDLREVLEEGLTLSAAASMLATYRRIYNEMHRGEKA